MSRRATAAIALLTAAGVVIAWWISPSENEREALVRAESLATPEPQPFDAKPALPSPAEPEAPLSGICERFLVECGASIPGVELVFTRCETNSERAQARRRSIDGTGSSRGVASRRFGT
jgi:hypothetical protein